MALRTTPHGEDPGKIAGGDSASEAGTIPRSKARPIAFSAGPPLGQSPASPPGEGKQFVGSGGRGSWSGGGYDSRTGAGGDSGTLATMAGTSDQIENQAQREAEQGSDVDPDSIPFLQYVREAEATSARYIAQVNRKAWSQSLRAYNNQHFTGSKYTRVDWRSRSKFFRPKTRTSVKKDMAAVAASLFGNIDAINCLPGNEADPRQRAAAALMEEVVNYRTDRSSGKAAMPWFQVAMGARQNALIMGVCVSKQYWKFELRKSHVETVQQRDDRTGEMRTVKRDVWVKDIDRPDCQLIPTENITLDPAAEWTDPIQSASYVIIKWPMNMEEVRKRQNTPINPWKDVSPSVLLANTDSGTTDTSAIRRSRELGIDRMDESQTGTQFQVVWVYEVFMRVDGEDWTFFCAGDRAFLTDPKPTREVYPEQFGERPLTMGVGNLDAHRVFPMSPVESWQQHQGELNDIVNLRLDAVKQNVMPVTKVVKGKGVDLDQVKRRSYGSTIMVQDEKDVTFDRPQDIPQSVGMLTRELELEMDDLAGQFNGQTAESNNALSRTLGGLKLVSGSANAVQEFDIRVWIETWCAPTLAQIVRLEQYYEHDDVILGLCGDRAQLFTKYGVSKIDDELIEEEIAVRVSVGLGAGDPQQRLMKFGQVLQIVAPIIAQSPEFLRGEKEIDVEAICEYVFGAGGFRDGGARFFKQGQPKQQDPLMDLKADEIRSKIEKNRTGAKAALITSLSAAAKAMLGERELEDDQVNSLIEQLMAARDMGFTHGHKHNEMLLSARDHGHRHGMDVRQQGHQERQPQLPPGGGTGTGGAPEGNPGASPPPGPPPAAGGGGPPPQGGAPPQQGEPPVRQSYMTDQALGEPPPPQDSQPSPQQQQMQQARYIEFVRDPVTNQIKGMMLGGQPPSPNMPPPAQRTPPPLPPFAQPGA